MGENESRARDGCQVQLRSLLTHHEQVLVHEVDAGARGVNVSFTVRTHVNDITPDNSK